MSNVPPPSGLSPEDSAKLLASLSPADVESHGKRVTMDDVRRVTPEQIRAVMSSMTRDQLKAAMRVMVDYNRFPEIMANAQPQVLDEAISHAKVEYLGDAALAMQGNNGFQSMILNALNADYMEKCSAQLAPEK